MNKPIRLLYAEDNLSDADLTKKHFAREAPEFQLEIIDTGEKCVSPSLPQSAAKFFDNR